MSEVSVIEDPAFKIIVSQDRMTATLVIHGGAKPSSAAVIAKLRDLKLASFDEGCVLEAIEKHGTDITSVIVATGAMPVDERAGRIEYLVPLSDISHGGLSKVESGQVVAKITQAVPGVAGRDLFGRSIPAGKGEKPVEIGRNLNLAKGELIATAAGNLRVNRKVLSVEPLLEIRVDDGSNSAINFDGDAIVKGSLNDGRIVQISGGLVVGGAIEAVQLIAGGSVNVKGGVVGHNKGRLVIGGDLRCRFISGSFITVAGNIDVQSEIIQSRIECVGWLTVTRGPICGGRVAANGGISCQVLGHPNETPTIVEAADGGAQKSFLASATASINSNRKRVSEVRGKIEPLMKQMKHLTAQQREKATELLYEAEQLEAATEKMMAEMDSQAHVLGDKARGEIKVAHIIHPGVTVCISGVRTHFSTAIKGPLTLISAASPGGMQIMLVDDATKSTVVLPAMKMEFAPSPRIAPQRAA